jgi:thymidylate synthase (FAD)
MTTWEQVADDSRYTKVLDKGFVGLIDHMGSDQAIVQAARVSYGEGTKSVNEDRGLIRYLMRHMHSTPFEMVEFKFHLKMPIFVMRQHVRHRMASINEYSGRYSVMTDEFYIPEPTRIQAQSSDNKQGSAGQLAEQELEIALNTIQRVSAENYLDYLSLINDPNGRDYKFGERQGLARELARMVLPVNNYTELYWKIDLKNLFHYLNLRIDSHAQYEIQQLALPIAEHVKRICPIAWEAFEDYWQQATTVSRLEKNLLQELINFSNVQSVSFADSYETMIQTAGSKSQLQTQFGMSKRELAEFEKQWKLAL